MCRDCDLGGGNTRVSSHMFVVVMGKAEIFGGWEN